MANWHTAQKSFGGIDYSFALLLIRKEALLSKETYHIHAMSCERDRNMPRTCKWTNLRVHWRLGRALRAPFCFAAFFLKLQCPLEVHSSHVRVWVSHWREGLRKGAEVHREATPSPPSNLSALSLESSFLSLLLAAQPKTSCCALLAPFVPCLPLAVYSWSLDSVDPSQSHWKS